jgi:hypothetical protein
MEPTKRDASGAEVSILVQESEEKDPVLIYGSQPDFLDGIHYYASLPEGHQEAGQVADNSKQATPHIHQDHNQAIAVVPAPAVELIPPPVVDLSARNLVVLQNFDANAIKDRETQRRILFKQRTSRPHSAWIPFPIIDSLVICADCGVIQSRIKTYASSPIIPRNSVIHPQGCHI